MKKLSKAKPKKSAPPRKTKASAVASGQWALEQRLRFLQTVVLAPDTESKMSEKLRALELYSKLAGDLKNQSHAASATDPAVLQLVARVRATPDLS